MDFANDFAGAQLRRAEQVELWLRNLRQDRGLSRAVRGTLDAIVRDPEAAAFASTSEMAKVANVNVATITRTAQALDFKGWPALRGEIRSRFLESLTVSEMAQVHSKLSRGDISQETLEKEIENLEVAAKFLGPATIKDFATAFAKAKTRLILGLGSQAGVGVTFAHNANIAGYSALLLDDQTKVVKALSEIDRKTVLVVISLWRTYKDTFIAVKQAKEAGAVVCIITDSISSPIAKYADHLLIVSADSTSFFISLVPSLAVVEGICAELAAIDPHHTQHSLTQKEGSWQEFGMLLDT